MYISIYSIVILIIIPDVLVVSGISRNRRMNIFAVSESIPFNGTGWLKRVLGLQDRSVHTVKRQEGGSWMSCEPYKSTSLFLSYKWKVHISSSIGYTCMNVCMYVYMVFRVSYRNFCKGGTTDCPKHISSFEFGGMLSPGTHTLNGCKSVRWL